MQHIIGMPPHIIIIGMPLAIMVIMRSQAIFIMSMVMPSPGVILQTMPVGVISQVMVAAIMGIIIGMGMFIGIPIPIPMFIGIPMPMFMPIGIIMFIGIGIMPMFMGIWFIGICMAVIMVITLRYPAAERGMVGGGANSAFG